MAIAVALETIVQAYLALSHSPRTAASLAWLVGPAVAIEALLVLVLLVGEESRLASELRTARTGTPALRALVSRRRARAPLFGRMLTTPLGEAAVLIADGDRAAAVAALARGSPMMQGGRLQGLRAFVDADLDRATRTPAGLARSIERLRSAARTGNREADLYRTHVLVKAVLEKGDGEVALDLATALSASADEDERLYGIWLRAWFALDREPSQQWPPVPESELRIATLVARAHGAERLVEELEARLATIARPERQE